MEIVLSILGAVLSIVAILYSVYFWNKDREREDTKDFYINRRSYLNTFSEALNKLNANTRMDESAEESLQEILDTVDILLQYKLSDIARKNVNAQAEVDLEGIKKYGEILLSEIRQNRENPAGPSESEQKIYEKVKRQFALDIEKYRDYVESI